FLAGPHPRSLMPTYASANALAYRHGRGRIMDRVVDKRTAGYHHARMQRRLLIFIAVIVVLISAQLPAARQASRPKPPTPVVSPAVPVKSPGQPRAGQAAAAAMMASVDPQLFRGMKYRLVGPS